MKNTILKKIRESLIKANVAERLANSVKFPQTIEIEAAKDRIVMKLSAKAIGMCGNARSYSNMQSDDAYCYMLIMLRAGTAILLN